MCMIQSMQERMERGHSLKRVIVTYPDKSNHAKTSKESTDSEI